MLLSSETIFAGRRILCVALPFCIFLRFFRCGRVFHRHYIFCLDRVFALRIGGDFGLHRLGRGVIRLVIGMGLLSLALMQSDRQHRSASVIDPLTSMLNRNALRARVDELVHQAKVVNQPIAVVVADIDHFKLINDSHGHAVGDVVLRDLAYRMRKRLRAFDLAYRIGGEEFAILLPGADADQAGAVAEELRAGIADEPIAGIEVTVSFGVSASLPGAFDYDATFKAADGALYEAKRLGRNRVELATAPDAAHRDLVLA